MKNTETALYRISLRRRATSSIPAFQVYACDISLSKTININYCQTSSPRYYNTSYL
ncbi:hypothetical protein Plhal304r1_c057g0143651 [Plasmopara halstedii]